MTSSGNCTPVVVSSGADDDVPIYLHVLLGDNCEGGPGFCWYVFNTKTSTATRSCKNASPLFEETPFLREYSGCVFVGATLYLIGGRDYNYRRVNGINPPSGEVFYIDTTSTSTLFCPKQEQVLVSGAGWKKLDHSLNVPRLRPYAFTVNGKIYVMGGGESPKPEVLDTRCMDDGWQELQDLTDGPGHILGHAVIDGGKRILVQSTLAPHLCCYDVEADSWQVYLEHVKGVSPGWIPRVNGKSAFVDGILYYEDYYRPGFLWGIDVSRPDDPSDPEMVRLPLDALEGWPLGWRPLSCYDVGECFVPELDLLSLGSEKLGLLWSIPVNSREVHVYCYTFKISKEEKKHKADGRDNFYLVAHPLSFSNVIIPGKHVFDWLTVYPSQSTGPKEDVYKDSNRISVHEDVGDCTVSANHKGSIGGSKNRKKRRKSRRVGSPSTKELAENCTSSSKSTLGCPGKAKTATSSSGCHGVSIEQAIEERDQALEKLAELQFKMKMMSW